MDLERTRYLVLDLARTELELQLYLTFELDSADSGYLYLTFELDQADFGQGLYLILELGQTDLRQALYLVLEGTVLKQTL